MTDASSTDACCQSESATYTENRRLSSFFLAETKREVSRTTGPSSTTTRSVLPSSSTTARADGRPNFFIPGINGKALCLDGKNKPVERPTDVIIFTNKPQIPPSQQQQQSEDETGSSSGQHQEEAQQENGETRQPQQDLLVRTESSYLLEIAEAEALEIQPDAPNICSRLPSIYVHKSRISGSVGEAQPESSRVWGDSSLQSSFAESDETAAVLSDWDSVLKVPRPRRYNSERRLGSSSSTSLSPLFPTCPFSAYRPQSAFQSFEKSRSLPSLSLSIRQQQLQQNHDENKAEGSRTKWQQPHQDGRPPMFPKTIKEAGHNSFTTTDDESSDVDDASTMVLEGWRARPAENEEPPRWNETPSSAGMASSSKASSKDSLSKASMRGRRMAQEAVMPKTTSPPSPSSSSSSDSTAASSNGESSSSSTPTSPVISWRGRQESPTISGESSLAGKSSSTAALVTWRGPAAQWSHHTNSKQHHRYRPAFDRVYQSERGFRTEQLYGSSNGGKYTDVVDGLEKKTHVDKSFMNQSDRGPVRRGLWAESQNDESEDDEVEEEDDDEEDYCGEDVSKDMYTMKSSTATTEAMDEDSDDTMTEEGVDALMDLDTYSRVQARREYAFVSRQNDVRKDIEEHLKAFAATRRSKSCDAGDKLELRPDAPGKYDEPYRQTRPVQQKVPRVINTTAPKAA